jgi:hypothetical protein
MVRTALLAASLLAGPVHADIVYLDHSETAGGATDLSGIDPAFGGNRLSFGSDLWYSRDSRTYWGITDRGPGGGLIDFQPRVHNFAVDLSGMGQINSLTLLRTVTFKAKDGTPFSGLNPRLLNGNAANLGLSFDPEGVVRLKNGHFIISDEYGPSVYEFDRDGVFVRAFDIPANLRPKEAGGAANFVDGRPTIVNGRQDNRGFEGLTLSPDGKTLTAVLQDPLVDEGAQNDGRRSRNVRMVQFDLASGEATGQFIYRLEDRDNINLRVPDDTFNATAQGRNIGLSAIIALPNGKFLVLERDNRGFGIDDATGLRPVGTKRVWLVDLAGATDVSGISLAGANPLPEGVVPVSKTLWLDIQAALEANGVIVGEKIEGIAFGPNLAGGGRAFVVVTDNDFSVTQTGEGVQFNRCTSGIGGIFSDADLNSACPEGQSLIPTFTYVFGVTGADLSAAGIPEPATWALLIAGFGLVGTAARCRRRVTAAA